MSAMTQQVSVGRIVHYCISGREPPPRSTCFHYDAIEKRSCSPGYDAERLVVGESLAGSSSVSLKRTGSKTQRSTAVTRCDADT